MQEPIHVLYYNDAGRMDQWQKTLGRMLPSLKLVTADSPDADKADVLMTWNPPNGLIADHHNLKGVISLGQGVDHVLKGKTFPPHLKLARLVDPFMADSMAEWVLLAILEKHRERDAYRDLEKRQEWVQFEQRLAGDYCVAGMGLGAIGSVVAQKAAMMGFRTIGWSRTAKTLSGVDARHGDDGFIACLGEADYLVSILPLTPETTDLYDAGTFARMKPGAVFINSGRGLQVVEDDLIAAIDNGMISAAVLDVTRTEPLPGGHPLWDHPGVTIWPHVSAQTSEISAAPQVVEAIKAIRAGREPENNVDISRGY